LAGGCLAEVLKTFERYGQDTELAIGLDFSLARARGHASRITFHYKHAQIHVNSTFLIRRLAQHTDDLRWRKRWLLQLRTIGLGMRPLRRSSCKLFPRSARSTSNWCVRTSPS
jgi:hypothetical protein